TAAWQLVLLWGVVVGLGTGAMTNVLAATVATRWFVHRRGLVVGALTAAAATGQLVFLPLLAALAEGPGCRWCWRSCATRRPTSASARTGRPRTARSPRRSRGPTRSGPRCSCSARRPG